MLIGELAEKKIYNLLIMTMRRILFFSFSPFLPCHSNFATKLLLNSSCFPFSLLSVEIILLIMVRSDKVLLLPEKTSYFKFPNGKCRSIVFKLLSRLRSIFKAQSNFKYFRIQITKTCLRSSL